MTVITKEAVAEDVREGYVSVAAAKKYYRYQEV